MYSVVLRIPTSAIAHRTPMYTNYAPSFSATICLQSLVCKPDELTYAAPIAMSLYDSIHTLAKISCEVKLFGYS